MSRRRIWILFFLFFNMCLNTLICLNRNGFCLEADGGAEQLNQPSAKTLKIKVKGTVR